MVAKPEDLQEQTERHLTLPESANRADFHRIFGSLLGYPKCCTEEYITDRTPEQKKAKRNGHRHLSYKFGQELDAIIQIEGNYPDIFDYRPLSFTPCGINCPEAIRDLTSWKEAINVIDPKTGRELVYFNRRGLPERLAHNEYLQQEGQIRNLEYKLELLRESAR